MRRRRVILGLSLAVALIAAGCNDDAGTSPGKDARVADLGADTGAEDGGADKGTSPDKGVTPDKGMTPDKGVTPDKGMTADKGVTPDKGMTPDKGVAPDKGVTPDAPPAAAQWIVYSANTSAYRYTVRKVRADGTGYTPVRGLPGSLSIESYAIPGPVPYYADFQRHAPRKRWLGREVGIGLPGGLGVLYRWQLGGTSGGLFVVRPDGTILDIDRGTGSATFGYRVAVSPDGRIAAAVKQNNIPVLLRLDGTTWPGTSSRVKDLRPKGWTATTAYYSSLTMTGKYVYLTAKVGSGSVLYRAPLDGSAPLSAVSISGLGSRPWINWDMAVSRDRSTLAVVAGISSAKEWVFVVRDSGGAPVRVSGATAMNLTDAGGGFMDSRYPQLALSPKGTYVAYLSGRSGSTPASVRVVKTDGKSTPMMLNTKSNFKAPLATDTFGNFFWPDERNLVFAAGTTYNKLALYRYPVGAKSISALAGASGASAPFGDGTLDVDGGWVTPDGTALYVVLSDRGIANIARIDLKTFAVKPITSGLDVYSGSRLDHGYDAAPGSPLVWFWAVPKGKSTRDLWVLDQKAGTPARKVTSNPPAASSVTGLVASPNGRMAAYIINRSAAAELWVASASGTKGWKVAGPAYIDSNVMWTRDGKSLIYAAGSSSSKMDLYRVAVTGGAPKRVVAAGAYVYILRGY